QRRRSDVPVLLTSGYSEAAAEDAARAGVQLLPKPYQIDELAAALTAARAGGRPRNAAYSHSG
ncbi:hypothetical protein, partial [Aeromonas veronii]|uniref:hypothetical protein n=1 Tax=Aeromonas veronii TaxID=654 RepID=UPI00406C97C2